MEKIRQPYDYNFDLVSVCSGFLVENIYGKSIMFSKMGVIAKVEASSSVTDHAKKGFRDCQTVNGKVSHRLSSTFALPVNFLILVRVLPFEIKSQPTSFHFKPTIAL